MIIYWGGRSLKYQRKFVWDNPTLPIINHWNCQIFPLLLRYCKYRFLYSEEHNNICYTGTRGWAPKTTVSEFVIRFLLVFKQLSPLIWEQLTLCLLKNRSHNVFKQIIFLSCSPHSLRPYSSNMKLKRI